MSNQTTVFVLQILKLAIHLDFFRKEFSTFPKLISNLPEKWLYIDWLWFLLEINWSGIYE